MHPLFTILLAKRGCIISSFYCIIFYCSLYGTYFPVPVSPVINMVVSISAILLAIKSKKEK